jgi:hypothetical protein
MPQPFFFMEVRKKLADIKRLMSRNITLLLLREYNSAHELKILYKKETSPYNCFPVSLFLELKIKMHKVKKQVALLQCDATNNLQS